MQTRKVLAVLALTTNVPLSADQIVSRIWDGDPPLSAAQMVRNQVRILRHLAGTAHRGIIERSQTGYLLADGVEVDATQFAALVQQARAARSGASALCTVQRALALWRGSEALVGVRDVPLLDAAAVTLEEVRFQTEEFLADCYLTLGQPNDALPLLQGMTVRHPSRQLPWLRLMAAQSLVGRRAEAAVETYRRARHHLVEETGLDAHMLADVHRALLREVDGREIIAMISRNGEWGPTR